MNYFSLVTLFQAILFATMIAVFFVYLLGIFVRSAFWSWICWK